MADIHITRDTAERIIAQTLRDNAKVSAADANPLAAKICDRLQAGGAAPTKPPVREELKGYKLIWPEPSKGPVAKDFLEELQALMHDIEPIDALNIWRTVYKHCRSPQ